MKSLHTCLLLKAALLSAVLESNNLFVKARDFERNFQEILSMVVQDPSNMQHNVFI
jgi:hypothetical protein